MGNKHLGHVAYPAQGQETAFWEAKGEVIGESSAIWKLSRKNESTRIFSGYAVTRA
jgi:hypothetical protein